MSRFLLFIFALALIAAVVLFVEDHRNGAIVCAIAAVMSILLWLTFLPTFIAYRREHPNRIPILLVNLFFGWTLVGWVVALVWACIAFAEPVPARGFADGH